MTTILSGPMFEPDITTTDYFKITGTTGAHYSVFEIKCGVLALRRLFPTGTANALNFVLFSTSGIHGSYATIENIERSLRRFGPNPTAAQRGRKSYVSPDLTVLIVQPRTVTLRYGVVRVTLDDVEFLKRLRGSSWRAMQAIGGAPPAKEQG